MRMTDFWVLGPRGRLSCTIINKTKIPCGHFGTSQFPTSTTCSYSWLSAILTSSQPLSL